MLRGIGLVQPQMREVVDIRHQWDQPFVIDSTETTDVLGLTATPWAEVVRATVGDPAARSGVTRPAGR